MRMALRTEAQNYLEQWVLFPNRGAPRRNPLILHPAGEFSCTMKGPNGETFPNQASS